MAYHHLLPLRHAADCADRCKPACPVRQFSEALAAPVLPNEVTAEKAEEERFKALARGEFPA